MLLIVLYLKLVGVVDQVERIERMRKRNMGLVLVVNIKQMASIASKQCSVRSTVHSMHILTCVLSAQHLI